MSQRSEPRVEAVHASAHTLSTEAPEAGGTYEWDHTTLVLALATSGDATGIGYTYGDTAVAHLVGHLAPLRAGTAKRAA